MIARINKLIPKYINDSKFCFKLIECFYSLLILLFVSFISFITTGDSVNAIENYLLLILLKGICLRVQKQYSDAEKCFSDVFKK